jgi:hypothetical protein
MLLDLTVGKARGLPEVRSQVLMLAPDSVHAPMASAGVFEEEDTYVPSAAKVMYRFVSPPFEAVAPLIGEA